MSDPKKLPARWAYPGAARKAHWFPADDIRSACGSWMFTGEADRYQELGAEPGRNDCRACWRRAKKAQEDTEDGR